MAEWYPHTETFSSSEDFDGTPLRLLPPGTQLGNRYEIRRAIDWGGSAVVYVAWDGELHRQIALKVLRPDRMTDAAMRRMRREVAVARDCSSPRLVRVFDIETSDGAIYLTMELVEGQSLGKMLAGQTRLPIESVVRVTEGIAEGLEALHELGIVHRDVKPGNVLLDGNGQVKVADFGLARHVDSETRATTTGSVVGTLAYLSPEQALGHEVDHRCDLYALGVVMFEMLTGMVPFEAASPLGTLLARMKATPQDVRRLRKDCPRWLAAIVARLLERNPEDRYPSAGALLQDLRGRRAPLAPTRARRMALMLGATLVAAVVTAGTFWWSSSRRAFSHLVTLDEGRTAAVSRSGAVLWQVRGVHGETASHYAVLERGHDGRREIAVVLRKLEDRSMTAVHTLSFLDPQTGAVRRRVRLPDAASQFPGFPRHYLLHAMRAVDLDGDGAEEVIATFIQNPEWPSYTVLYEPLAQRARVVFVATGHHEYGGAADVDGDGHQELLFRGIHNGYGWYNAVAAVRLQPPVNVFGPTPMPTETPDIARREDDQLLLWYAYLPRRAQDEGTTVTLVKDRIRITYPDGHVVLLGTDGIAPGLSNRAARAAARKEVFASLRAADRLVGAGSFDRAIAAGGTALRAAHICGEPLLIEAVQVRRGRYLVRASRIAEAEAHYEAISRGSIAASAIAMEAAEELHLHGEVGRAVNWYRRALSYARPDGISRARHEMIEGLVMALEELGRRGEGIAEVNRFLGVYQVERSDWLPYYREFLRWRSGERPDVEGIVVPENGIDVLRYWQLEFSLANGAAPPEILARIDPELESHSPIRGPLLSLHAELLQRLGRTAEARAMVEKALRLTLLDVPQTTLSRGHLAVVQERSARIHGEGVVAESRVTNPDLP